MLDKTKFPIETRVKLSPLGVSKLGAWSKIYDKNTEGKVVGYGRHRDSIRVIRDGITTPYTYYDAYWEKCKKLTLREKQSKFVRMVAILINFAYENGYELTFGDAWARDGHKDHSFHYCRLAIDLNLFKDGKYLASTEDHKELGEFWESIGGSWGGRWGDGNHYSLGENK